MRSSALQALPPMVLSVVLASFLPRRDVAALTLASSALRDQCALAKAYWDNVSTLLRMGLAGSAWELGELRAALLECKRHEAMREQPLRFGGQTLLERLLHSIVGLIWTTNDAGKRLAASRKGLAFARMVVGRVHRSPLVSFDRAARSHRRAKATRLALDESRMDESQLAPNVAFLAAFRRDLAVELGVSVDVARRR